MEQALASFWEGKTYSWLIIVQRDFRNAAAFVEARMLLKGQPLYHARKKLLRPPAFSYRLRLPTFGKVQFIGVSLEKFLASVKPSELVRFRG